MQQFYADKHVFVTGGSGFLGKVFIEKLLRSTEVACIYVLLRPKQRQQQSIEQRLADMLQEPLFEVLHKEQPLATQRVVAIHGDVALPNLGLSPPERQMLIERVQVVVHGAATVRFTDPLYDTLNVNSYPNNYTFTKALAEQLITSQCSTFPVGIIRPGIVIASCCEPMPGWTDNLYGPIGTLLGVARGIIRVVYGREEDTVPLVPVDFCANAIAAMAWHVACETAKPTSVERAPLICNFVPDAQNPITWRRCAEEIRRHGAKIPLLDMMWHPIFIPVRSKVLDKLLCFLCHTVPGYLFDLLLLLQGRKPWVSKLYAKIHKNVGQLDYFKSHVWTFETTNMTRLWQALTPADQRCYNFDMSALNWRQYIKDCLTGMRWHLAKEKPDNIPKAQRRLKQLLLLHRVVKLVVYGGALALLWWTFNKVRFD